MTSFSLEEERELQNELSTGESLQWSGKPNPRVVFHPSDWFAIPFSLFWVGFTVFWEFSASKGGGWFFELWGIPFILIGQYLLWGRFVYAAWKKRRVLYILTDRRAVTLVTGRGSKVISAELDNVPSIEKQVRADGIGTINIGAGDLKYNVRGRQTTADDLYLSRGFPVFVDIDDADQVYTRLRNLQRTSRDKRFSPQ